MASISHLFFHRLAVVCFAVLMFGC